MKLARTGSARQIKYSGLYTVTRAVLVAMALLFTIAQAYAAGSATILHTFTGGADGSYPYAALTTDAKGNLYGTTQIGGAYGYGTVFMLSPTSNGGWQFSLLHEFTGGANGGNPLGSLVFDAAGNGYGTTSSGGANGLGCVFELSPPASRVPGKVWNETVLYSFQGGSDGAVPFGNVVFDATGNMYGTTSIGGTTHIGCPPTKGCGTVYELSPEGNGVWQETVIHRFADAFGEGSDPVAGLVFDATGNLYGTTYEGGNNSICNGFGCGTVFELEPSGGQWQIKVLGDFNEADGALPRAGVTLDGAGNLYGVTTAGGAHNAGTVFSMINESGKWKPGKLYSFDITNGLKPSGTLALDAAGNLYGTSYQGGANDWGDVFELVPNAEGWTEHVLYSFAVSGKGLGANPLDGVLLDGAGNLYLTTNQGGNINDCSPNSGCGTVVEFSPATGLDLLYGAPADAFLNTFPVLTIDPATGGFSNFFNVTAPPPFTCSTGSAALGSQFFYISLPPGCQNQTPQIIGYSIDPSTGVLSALNGSPFPLPSNSIPQGMATVPNSNLLYVADLAGSIDVFAVDSTTGVPTAIPGSPFTSGTNYQLVIDPSGKYLYAADYDPPGGVFAFSIGSGGALTPVPGSPFLVPAPTPNANFQPFGIVDTGKYVYIALVTNQIAGFSIENGTGALKPLAGPLFPTGNGPGPLVLTGNFLYTVNQLDGSISGYSINDATGALTTVPGSPFGTDGVWLAADLSGKYLYLSEKKGVQGYNIDLTTGTLTLGTGFHDNDGSLWLTPVKLPAP